MVKQLIFRFIAGGVLVAAFASLGDIFKPKSFAGLFGAAPSVALATLTLTIFTEGAAYAALEARSMIAGAAGFFAYACCVTWLMFRYKPSAMLATSLLLVVWFATAFGLWLLWLR